MRLKDKVALITGGGSGIGAAVARRFAREGALVAVADVVPQGAEGVIKEIAAGGGKAIFTQADVRKAGDVSGMIDYVVKEYGHLDILINNAGVTKDNLCARMSEEEWDFVVAVNLKGSFLCAQAAYRPMRKQKYGRIVNTSSVVSRGNMGQVNYSASKAGVIGLTRTLALEYARSNITVNCIAPGFIDTPMAAAMDDKVKALALERIPLSRMGTPEEVANLHLFLASEEAAYITGQVIFLDGGASIGI
ncbi:MAG: 3-oxoacyl-[acyl-carrier-protein] reductase [Deltaproteobacteria bacterium RBG_16_54_18]|nr:MAG: 3-oxoacyl-[acyl-carrier-protein] reductase [Deltaproteobacteria bacterium RBG_16_54_18]